MTEQNTLEVGSKTKVSPTLVIFLALPLLGVLAAAVVILTSRGANSAVEPTPEPVSLPSAQDVINAPMIDFTLNTLNGQGVSLSDFKGRIVFLNFWATWCGPCEREIPTLQAFTREQANVRDGAVVLAVDMQEAQDDITRFLDARSITSLLVLMDEQGAVSDQYGVFNLPVTFVIDRSGIVRYPKYGEVTLDDLHAYIDALNQDT